MSSSGNPSLIADSASQEMSEVLLLDKDARIRDGMRKLLAANGVIVTGTDDIKKALGLAAQKFFSVAVIDIDTPKAEQGLEVLLQLKASSPATAVVLLTQRATFDLAARGFRAGAADVVAKLPESVKSLVQKVTSLCLTQQQQDERERVLREVLEVHEQFLKRLMDTNRKLQQAEDQAMGQQDRFELGECRVLVVDENTHTAPGLQEALGQSSPYKVASVLSGGEALDRAGQEGFHLALVNEKLPDLPWSMVTKGLKNQSPDSIVLLFTKPEQGPGKVSVVEEHQQIELIAELRQGKQLAQAIQEMREAYLAKHRERHYLQAFRRDHFDFLKRYVELRQKLSALLPDGRK